jgi:hypothetical protein
MAVEDLLLEPVLVLVFCSHGGRGLVAGTSVSVSVL